MKKVALVLASGGSRGMAHIGAIEELLERGYEITSIAGCSIGSLVAGIYASGKLSVAHEWFANLTKQQIFELADISLGLSHVVKGDKVLDAIREFVPDRKIEELPIPVAMVATDLINAKPVVFRQGDLFSAIRASISIPLFFRPVQYQDTLLVDGGLVNPFPLDIVQRQEGDLLMGVNISAQDKMEVSAPTGLPMPRMLGHFSSLAERWNQLAAHDANGISSDVNYFSLINRTIDIQIQRNGALMTQFYHPDVVVEMPQNAFSTFDFDKAEHIMECGRLGMRKALDDFERQHE